MQNILPMTARSYFAVKAIWATKKHSSVICHRCLLSFLLAHCLTENMMHMSDMSYDVTMVSCILLCQFAQPVRWLIVKRFHSACASRGASTLLSCKRKAKLQGKCCVWCERLQKNEALDQVDSPDMQDWMLLLSLRYISHFTSIIKKKSIKCLKRGGFLKKLPHSFTFRVGQSDFGTACGASWQQLEASYW